MFHKISLEFNIKNSNWRTSLPNYHALSQKAAEASLQHEGLLKKSLEAQVKTEAQVTTNSISAISASSASHCPIYLSILLTDDEEIAQLNKQYRNKDKPTDVLSFPYLQFPLPGNFTIIEGENDILGDVVFAYQTTYRDAKEAGVEFSYHYCHLLIHSILHLLGYDHIEQGESKIMQHKEQEILQKIKG